MEKIFITLFNMSIAAGWLVIAVVALRAVLYKVPKSVICLLWAAVAVRLVIPFLPESSVSLIPGAETLPKDIIYTEAPEIHSGIYALNSIVNPIISESLAPEAGASVNPVQILLFAASFIWIAGMIMISLYALISYFRLFIRTRASISTDKNIRICDNISTPFILGLFRPCIFIPSYVDEKCKELILAHERAHIKRLDYIWKPLGFALLTVYWFNPLMWVAYILFCRDMELACDYKVIKDLGVSIKKPYSEALLLCSVRRKIISACPLAFGEIGIKKRIKAILDYKKPAVIVIIISVFAIIVTAVCFLTNPVAVPESIAEENGGETGINKIYGGQRIVYECGMFSSIFYTDENIPQFSVTNDMELLTSEVPPESVMSGVFYKVGKLEEITLTEQNFDAHLFSEMWDEGFSAEQLRSDNKKAYCVVDKEWCRYYYLLFQKDESVYITSGYTDEEELGVIRYIFKMHPKISPVSSFKENMNVSMVLAYRNSIDMTDPTVMLNTDGTFTFTWSMFSSYIAHGTYELTDSALVLTTDDGLNVYTFIRYEENEKFYFDAGNSSKIPKYRYAAGEEARSPVPDRAAFERIYMIVPDSKYSPITDSTFGDINGDGIEEYCTLSYGPTSGIFSFYFTASDSETGETVKTLFSGKYLGNLSFAKGENGKLRLKCDDNGAVHLFDISICDGNIVLSENGVNIYDIS